MYQQRVHSDRGYYIAPEPGTPWWEMSQMSVPAAHHASVAPTVSDTKALLIFTPLATPVTEPHRAPPGTSLVAMPSMTHIASTGESPSIACDPQTMLLTELAVAEAAQAPNRIQAWTYLVKFAIYLTFLVILSVSVMDDRLTSRAFNVFRAVHLELATDALTSTKSIEDSLQYIQGELAPRFLNGFLSWDRRPLAFPMIFGGSYPLTTIRLRQHRVKPGCHREPWRDRFGVCHPSAGLSDTLVNSASQAPFTTDPIRGNFPGGAGTYSTSEFLCGGLYLCYAETTGDVRGATYPTGGYVYDMNLTWARSLIQDFAKKSPDGTVSVDQINFIADAAFSWITTEQWVDENTRVLIVEFTLMVSNLETLFFTRPTIVFDFYAEGGCFSTLNAFPLILNSSPSTGELLLLLYSATALVLIWGRNLFLWRKHTPCITCLVDKKWRALSGTMWYKCNKCATMFDRLALNECPKCATSVREWVHKCFFYGGLLDKKALQISINMVIVVIAFFFKADARKAFAERLKLVENEAQDLLNSNLPFIDFGPIERRMALVFQLNAINLFITYMGVFSFVGQFEVFGRFLRLFRMGASRIFTFLLTFSVIFMGFALAFHLSLGVRSEGFRTAPLAFMSTFRLMVGDFSFANFKGETVELVSTLYVFFAVLMVLISTNVFVSIIEMAHEAANSKMQRSILQSLKLLRGDVTVFLELKEKKNAATVGGLDGGGGSAPTVGECVPTAEASSGTAGMAKLALALAQSVVAEMQGSRARSPISR